MTPPSARAITPPAGGRCVFTICTKSYIGLAEALGASLRDHEADVDYFIVVADHDVSNVVSTVAKILSAKEFCGFTDKEWTQQTFKYDLVEFCTSIKARCFLSFVDRGYENLVYFDPDILVFDDMSQIFTALESHEVMLTPHRLDTDHDLPSRGGLFNLGFLAVRNSQLTRKMLRWWDDRLLHHSISDASRGYFTDQKWMDNLPLLIPPDRFAVSDHPGMNLAPWNLHEREAKQENGQNFVRLRNKPDDWRPVSFVHYSALSYPELARGVIGAKAQKVSARSKGFEPLVEHLAKRLKKSRFIEFEGTPYEFSTYSDGLPIHPGHRRIYARLQAEGAAPQAPFDAKGSFYQALKAKRMLVATSSKKSGAAAIGTRQVGRVVKLLDAVSLMAIRALGYDRYYLLSKFLTRYLHPVNHARLLNTKDKTREVEYF